MQITVSVEEQGHLVVPKRIIDSLRLEPGALVDIHIAEHTRRNVAVDERFNVSFSKYRDAIREMEGEHASPDDGGE